MNEKQFLTSFQKHLLIGEPKRSEIIAELEHHIDEDGVDRLGDARLLATKYNRTYLGFFSSISRLVLLRLTSFFVFEVGWTLIYLFWFAAVSTSKLSLETRIFILLAQTVPSLVFIFGAHHFASFQKRWKYIFWWTGSFALSGMIVQIIEQLTGFSLYLNAQGGPVWLSQLWQFFVVFLALSAGGLGIMVITRGRAVLFRKRLFLNLVVGFVVYGAAAYFLIPMAWNVITSHYYTVSMQHFDEWLYYHTPMISIIAGVLGVSLEWLRVRRFQNRKVANQLQ